MSRNLVSVAALLPVTARIRFLEYHLRSFVGMGAGKIAVRTTDDLTHPLAFRVERSCGEIIVYLGREQEISRWVFRMTCMRLPALIFLATRLDPQIGRITGEIGDGNQQEPDWLCFCSKHEDVFLAPDPIFFNSYGYATYRRVVGLPWDSRSSTVLWRGSSTGLGLLASPGMIADDTRLRPRVRLCLKLADMPDTDVKLRKLCNVEDPRHVEALRRAGIVGGKVPQSDWRKFKFAIDIDGFTNAWSNFFIRLLLGCCVIKVESDSGYRQWFYDRLVPWTHYVPVRADMDDLVEKIHWCRKHEHKCREIAGEGQALARSMTFESEMQATINRIDEGLRSVVQARGSW